MQWLFIDAWNAALVKPDKSIIPRDYIYASEVGGAHIDRYMKMMGEPFSNPPNERSLRKFQAGNIWEWVIGFILKRAGIMQRRQSRVEYTYPGLLRVSGKLDFIAGGKPDWEMAANEIEVLDFPERLLFMCKAVLEQLQATWSGEIPEIVLELKSAGSFTFEKYERTQLASDHHENQIFHYLKGLNMAEGHIVYVCREDCRMMECIVTNPGEVEERYKADITRMTDYYLNKQQPPKEKFILFSEAAGRFEKNWRVEYSPYLTKLYGFDNQFSFFNTFSKRVTAMNRVLARCVNGDKMTKLNLEVIDEAKKMFPDWDAKVEIGKALKLKGVEITEEQEEIAA